MPTSPVHGSHSSAARLVCLAVIVMLGGLARGTSAAGPLKRLDSLELLWSADGKIASKTIDYALFPGHKALSIIHPDRAANPSQKRESWAGPAVSDLLESAGLQPTAGTSLTFIATDNYVGSLDVKDAVDHQATIAIDRDGKRMASTAGGPHAVYAIGSPSFPGWLAMPGYWVWLVVRVVMGELPPLIELVTPAGTRQIDAEGLRKIGTQQSIKRFFPVGERHGGVPAKVTVEATTVRLPGAVQEIAKECLGKTLQAESLSGTSLEITPAMAGSLDLVLAWEGRPIPVRFGGPVQLCDLTGPRGCIYFLRRLVCS